MLAALRLAPFVVLAALASTTHAEPARIASAAGHFVVGDGKGQLVRGAALKGAVLTTRGPAGGMLEIRIDAVEPGPHSDIELYSLSVRDHSARGGWRAYCSKGQDGRARGFPIPTTDDATGAQSYTLVCTAGAQGKCVMRGYRPWGAALDGTPLSPLFEACVRMMRADYCGDGTPFTRAGIRLLSWDRVGIHTRPEQAPHFEAAWGPAGAICLTRPRVPSIAPLERIIAHCPSIAERVREDCAAYSAAPEVGAVLWNAVDRKHP